MTVKEFTRIIKAIIKDPKTLAEAKKALGVFTRKPNFTFKDALKFMLDMNKTSLQTRLDDFYIKTKNGERPVSQQYFSRLRDLFDHSPFEKMFRAVVKEEYSNRNNLPNWNGYHLLAVDGSKMQLPPDEKLREEFGVTLPGNNPAAGVSILHDLQNNWILDAILTHYNMNEKLEFKKHIEYLCTEFPDIAQNSIILGDRGIPSFEILEFMQSKELKYLFRCRKNFSTEIMEAPMGESEVILPNGVTVRVIKTILPSNELEILLTNLFDISMGDIIILYFKRWGIETMYSRLKETVSIEKFSGKTANSIRQDFWVSLVLMLSVTIFLKEADRVIRIKDEHKNNKHKRKARASNCIVSLRNQFIFHVLFESASSSMDKINDIISRIAYSSSPIRENRSYPRKTNNSKKVNHNMKSRL